MAPHTLQLIYAGFDFKKNSTFSEVFRKFAHDRSLVSKIWNWLANHGKDLLKTICRWFATHVFMLFEWFSRPRMSPYSCKRTIVWTEQVC